MKTTNNKSKFLAFLLSVLMISSAGAMFASCADDDDSSSTSSSTEDTTEEEETRKDEGDIKNANFDFTTLSETTVIGTSVTGWSRSVNSSDNASKSASGVLDTSDTSWKYMTERYKTDDELKAMTEADVIAAWDNFNAQDKLAYYKIWKDANKGKTLSASTFEKYESLNVDEEDIPAVNPGTHEVAEGEKALDSQVLMIHNNYYPNSSSKDKTVGTAQKWTSSSTVTVPSGSSAWVSVWVKTADLTAGATSDPNNAVVQDAVGKGAYISLTHSVGGKSLDAYEVKNIVADEWTKYTFYIKGSNYVDTTYSLVLGLGQGNTDNRFEYVNGYAFFDDIQYDIISNKEFDDATAGNTTIATLEDEKVDKTFDAYEMPTAYTFGMDFSTTWNSVDLGTITVEETEASVANKNPAIDSKDVTAVKTKAELNAYDKAEYKNLSIVYDKFLASDDTAPFLADDDAMLMLLSNAGTAYTAENAMTFTLEEGKDYMAVSFFVKTSDMNDGAGASVTLVDELNKTSFTTIDTTDIEKVKIGDDEDAYDGWQRYFFFVERAEDVTGDIDFSLTFNYGPTDITSSTAASNFQQGFAAFTKFASYEMTELEYEAATTGTYAKKVTLYGVQDDEATGNTGFDTIAGVPENALEDGNFANPQNYKGVYNDSYRVSLPLASDMGDTDEAKAIREQKRAYNQYANAGLLNREHYKAFLEAMSGTTVSEDDAATAWTAMFGDATQPLVISNDGLTDKSYGFIGTTKTLSDEYTAISVRVRTTDGAKASVYLMDMSDATRQSVLSVSRSLTYWYDENGNICTGDPSKKSSAIAFNLDKNGLYKANKNWEGYEKLGELKDAYFANLDAYTEKDGVLYASDDSASHDYYDYTWNREVFYKSGNAWYTEKNGAGVKVHNLVSITNGKDETDKPLTARYLPEDKQELKLENISSDNKWTTVTFYVRKGEVAKSYRLEVWSGTRDGATVCTTGMVAFDTNNPGTASSNFSALIEEFEDDAEIKFDSVFSYYDTDKHVRYDANLDADKSGNAYADNIKATLSSEESTAFLKHYSDETGYNVFADYSLSEKTVAASETDTDDDTDDSEEETDPDSDVNVWLLASSIAVAGVLVLAVVSIIVRKIVEKSRKKRGTRVRKVKAKKEPAAKKKVEKTVDEDSPYND